MTQQLYPEKVEEHFPTGETLIQIPPKDICMKVYCCVDIIAKRDIEWESGRAREQGWGGDGGRERGRERKKRERERGQQNDSEQGSRQI